MKHKPVDPKVADNLGTLMGVDAGKKRSEKPPRAHHDVKPETADGISNLIGIDVKPTSHEKQLCAGSHDFIGGGGGGGNKADAVLGVDVSGEKGRDATGDSIMGKAKKIFGT